MSLKIQPDLDYASPMSGVRVEATSRHRHQ